MELKRSTLGSQNQYAVKVERAFKRFGSKKKPFVVLNGVNMTVPKGTIYGLLGPSGCGKTTLLRCILGRQKLNAGTIRVFGEAPDTLLSSSRSRIGYMPQEIALYGDFTIKETLIYFGWIARMNNKEIREESDMLMKLLNIPQTEQRVKTLSGGEQRRVSLVAILLFKPELLILDEPTVGVDTILRDVIWNYLQHISSREHITIIVTTHYIEEARKADTISLMRKGVLLIEDAPENLLKQYGTQSLEDVFLRLCLSQSSTQKQHFKADTTSRSVDDVSYDYSKTLQQENGKRFSYYLPVFKRNHIKALIWKNALWWMRNITSLVYMLILSAAVLALFYPSIGQDPHSLPVAVVNYETNNSKCESNQLACDSTTLSCHYLERLDKDMIILKYYESADKAMASVFSGDTFASIVIKHNYSTAIQERIERWNDAESWILENSEIDVTRDTSYLTVSTFIKVEMLEAFQSFAKDYLTICDLNEKILSIPLQMNTPIYGTTSNTFTDFSLPGLLLSFAFLMGSLLMSNTMLVERTEASLERTLVMGITEAELIFAHIACEAVVLIVQSILMVVTAFVVFNTACNGSLLLVVLLTILVEFCGMCFGILISSIFDLQAVIFLGSMTIAIIFVLVSGVIWPMEGMHYLLKYVSPIFPLTKPTESVRNIVQKNWGIAREEVATGFISISIWSALFLTISLLYLKYKSN